MRTIKLLNLLGTYLGALSILLLIRYAINIGDFGTTFKIILNYYDKLIGVTINWMFPLAVELLKKIEEYFHLKLTLLPQWKHVFVIIWLYFIASSKMIWRRTSNKFLTIFGIIWGAICALFASIMSGAVQPSSDNDIVLMILLSVLWVVIFEIGITLAKTLEGLIITGKGSARIRKGLLNYIFPAMLIGVFSAWAAIKLATTFSMILNSGLVGIGIYILLLSFYWFLRACVNSMTDRKIGESYIERFLRAGGTELSTSVFRTIIIVSIFVLMNAGLSMVGL
ncbi:hypothetical protein KKC13_03645 [bacterium]|nr:hypothetical protein [bacterium]MBU1958504.1 hypothetical protein [bacterium]